MRQRSAVLFPALFPSSSFFLFLSLSRAILGDSPRIPFTRTATAVAAGRTCDTGHKHTRCSLSAGALNAGITVRYYGRFARAQTGTAELRGCTCGKGRDPARLPPRPCHLGPRLSSSLPCSHRRKGARVGRREILPHDERFIGGNDGGTRSGPRQTD